MDNLTSQISAEAQLRAENAELRARLGVAQELVSEQADETIARQARDLQALYETTPTGLFQFDADMRFVRVNAWTAAINGRSIEAHIGRTAREVLEPELAGHTERYLRQVLQTGEPLRDIEVHGTTAARGEERDWLVSYYPLRDASDMVVGVHGVVVDITERKQAEAERARLAAIVLGSEDAIIAKDLSGVIVSWNHAAERLFGYTAAEAIGRAITMLVPPELQEEEAQILKRMHEEGAFEHFETVRCRKDGTRVEVSLTISPVADVRGKIMGASKIARDISARKSTERALRESEEFTRRVLDNLFSFVGVMTLDGALIEVNRAPLEAAGISASDVLGKQFWDCYWWSYSSEVQSKLRDACERAAAGKVVRYDAPVRMAGEILMWIDFQIAPLLDSQGHITHLIPSGMDITSRRSDAEKLRASEERVRLAADATGVGIWEWNLVTNEMRWDAQLFSIYGAVPTPDGLVHYSDWSGAVLPEDLPENERTLQETVRRCGKNRREFRIVRRNDGKRRFIEAVETVRTNEHGQAEWVVGTNLDVTESKLAQEKVRVAKEGAEKANAAKDRFLAVLSHELRTPLTPVLMALGAMEHNPELSAEVRKDLVMMKRNIKLETKLIDDLLDLNTITSGKLVLEIALVDLNEAVRHVCSICRSDLQGRGIRLETVLDVNAGMVAADAARLQQVLWNVLRNAIKFTPEGGVIEIVTTSLSEDRRGVRVRDSGMGIAPEVLQHIFHAFEQGAEGITRKFGGLGLGLAISRGILDLHGGSIHAESEGPGKGATFSIELPAAHDAAISLPDGQSGDRVSAATLRVLVVEDHADTAQALARLLRDAGFAITLANDVASALAVAQRESFDLVLSDLGLPDGSGTDVMRELRTHSAIPGIAMSGYGMEDDLRRSREAGFSEHLVKPVDRDKLMEAIRRVTENRSARV